MLRPDRRVTGRSNRTAPPPPWATAAGRLVPSLAAKCRLPPLATSWPAEEVHLAASRGSRRRSGWPGARRGRAARPAARSWPSLQQHDAVGQRHRLDLVVGDVDHRRAELLVQALDLAAHLVAQLGVEIGQRLVEQEEPGLRARWPARSRRAGAGRPTAGAGSGRAGRRCRALRGALDAARRSRRSGVLRARRPKAMFS